MKKIYLLGVLCTYLFAGCGGQSAHHEHSHEGHEYEAHNHEGHGHEGHEHAEHEHDGHNHAEHEHNHVQENGHNHSPNEIIFKKAHAEAVGLKTEKVKPEAFVDVLKTSGRILAAQGDESVVVATVPGVVTFGNLQVVHGTPIRKGQTLLTLASSNLSDGNYALKVKMSYETAKKEYDRMKLLVDDKIVSAKDFEQARLNYENAKAAYDALAGKETAKGVAVVSPLNGYLKNIQVKEGDYVTVGQPLATISQNSRLTLRADVSEKYYHLLPTIQSAHFKTPYDNKLYKLSELKGRLLTYGRASDTDAFYVPVTFEFDNKGTIIPGSFVEVYLMTTPMEQVISVPVSALVEEQSIYSVYVRLDEEGYEKRTVTLGANNGERVQILSGLREGDEVVTEAAYQIKLSSASNAIPAHSHQH